MPARSETLRQRHAALEQRLQAEMARPRPDPVEIARIKAEKLRLKDQIAGFTASDTVVRGRTEEINLAR